MFYETIADYRIYRLSDLQEAAAWPKPCTVLVSAVRERRFGLHPTPLLVCGSLAEAHAAVEAWLKETEQAVIECHRENSVPIAGEEYDGEYAEVLYDILCDKFKFMREDDYTSTSEWIGSFDMICFDEQGTVLGRETEHIAAREDLAEDE